MHNLNTVFFFVFVVSSANAYDLVPSAKLDEQKRQQKREAYQSNRDNLEQFRKKKFSIYKSANTANRKKILSETRSRLEAELCENLFPAWYGTPWDFNGISQVPGTGEIACGYFVTTCLTHLGFNIPRVRLAQQPSQKIIRTFVDRSDMDISSQKSLPEMKEYFQASGNGIYIVGLDTHVGFVAVQGEEIIFVHSSYYQPTRYVKAEPYDSRNPLADSKYRVFGKIFHDKMLIKWLSNQAFAIGGG